LSEKEGEALAKLVVKFYENQKMNLKKKAIISF